MSLAMPSCPAPFAAPGASELRQMFQEVVRNCLTDLRKHIGSEVLAELRLLGKPTGFEASRSLSVADREIVNHAVRSAMSDFSKDIAKDVIAVLKPSVNLIGNKGSELMTRSDVSPDRPHSCLQGKDGAYVEPVTLPVLLPSQVPLDAQFCTVSEKSPKSKKRFGKDSQITNQEQADSEKTRPSCNSCESKPSRDYMVNSWADRPIRRFGWDNVEPLGPLGYLRKATYIVEGSSALSMDSFRLQQQSETRCLRYHLKTIVVSDWFDCAMGALLLSNAIVLGIQVDYMANNPGRHLPDAFHIAIWFHIIMFTAEIAMRSAAFGMYFFRMTGWQWNLFDTIILCCQLIEQVTTIFVDVDNGARNMMAVRVFRVFRLFRCLRFFRFLHLIPELRTIVRSLTNSARTFLTTCAMLLLLIYVFSVSLAQLVVDHQQDIRVDPPNPNLQRYFGGIWISMLSLFQAISGGVDWDDLLTPLRQSFSPIVPLLFVLFFAFMTLVVLNLVTGLFVDSAQLNIKEQKGQLMMTRIRELFVAMDTSKNGYITYDEFQGVIGHEYIISFFHALDVDVTEAQELFSLLDVNRSGSISFDDFLNGCLRLQGAAQAIDLITHVYNMRWMYESLARQIEDVQTALQQVHLRHSFLT